MPPLRRAYFAACVKVMVPLPASVEAMPTMLSDSRSVSKVWTMVPGWTPAASTAAIAQSPPPTPRLVLLAPPEAASRIDQPERGSPAFQSPVCATFCRTPPMERSSPVAEVAAAYSPPPMGVKPPTRSPPLNTGVSPG